MDGVRACEGGRKREWGRHNVRERERETDLQSVRGGETEMDGVRACEGGRKREWGRQNVRERERQWQGERERERMSQREGVRERWRGCGSVGGGGETNRGGRRRERQCEGDRREAEQGKKCACMHTCNAFDFHKINL